MIKLFKNIFKNKEEQVVDAGPKQGGNTHVLSPTEKTTKTEKKSVHGEDDNCCGGCS